MTTTEYDGLNRPTEVHLPSGSGVPAASKQSFYTPSGLVWKTIDELGRDTLSFYDNAGRAIRVEGTAVDDGSGSNVVRPKTYSAYDGNGNVIAVQDPLGRIVETEYDERNRPIEVKAPYVADAFTGTWKRPTTTTEYDDMGRPFRVTDPLGNITETSFDRAGRATGVKLPAVDVYGQGVQATYSRSNYDANGNVVQTIDARGRVLTNEYDAHNRLTKTTDALGAVTLFGYDKGSNRTSVTDANGNVTGFTYDAQKRVRTETYPGSQVLTYGYDKVNKTSRTDALGRQTTYAYDVRNRLKTVTYVSGVQGTRTYGYDDAGQLLSVTESAQPSADVTYTYDALGRVASEVSYGFTHEYKYDLAGNRIGTDYGTGRSETRVFDALNRPLQISEGGRLTDYYYDLAGRAVGLMSGNDQWSVNEYDAQSRLVRRTLKADASGWQPVMAELSFGYDAVGNLRQQKENWPAEMARIGLRTTTLSYDNGDRLRQELVQDDSGQKTTDYHYDGVGNRTLKLERTNGALQKQTSYTSNVRNQLTSWAEENGIGTDLRSATLGYDVAGNRTSQALTTHGPVPSTANTSYAWDYDNRLTTVTLPGSVTHSYAYDYRTRRIARTEGSLNPVAMTFSGGLSVAEYEVTSGTLNVDPTVEYQRGPDMGGGVGGLLYSLRSGTPKYNLSNGRGDVVAQSDNSGELTWTASYEAYGKRPVETGTNLDRQRANTKEEDPTGLLNEGFRYRDLETGTWLSRDPAGFVDGPNLYAYVRQNPWSKFDPLGLEEGKLPTTVSHGRLQKLSPDQEKQLVEKFNQHYRNTESAPTGRAFLKEMRENKNGKVEWKLDISYERATIEWTSDTELHITVNPAKMNDKTIPHEVGGHVNIFLEVGKKPAPSGTYGSAEYKQQEQLRAEREKAAANKVAPLHSDKDDPGERYENRGIRAGNIVYAEIELLKMTEEQRKDIPAILNDRKGTIYHNLDYHHPSNKKTIPPGTQYGGYTFDNLKGK